MPDEEVVVPAVPQQRNSYFNHNNNYYTHNNYNQHNHHNSSGAYFRGNNNYEYGLSSGNNYYTTSMHNGNYRGTGQRPRGSYNRNGNFARQQYQNRNYTGSYMNGQSNNYYTSNKQRGRSSNYQYQNYGDQRTSTTFTAPGTSRSRSSSLSQSESTDSKRASPSEQISATNTPYLNSSSSSSISSDGDKTPSSATEEETSEEGSSTPVVSASSPLQKSTSMMPSSQLIPCGCPIMKFNTSDLSSSIWRKFLACQQTFDTKLKKLELKSQLQYFVLPELKLSGTPVPYLEIVGSTVTGFGSRTCDVDICLMIRNSEVDQRIEAVQQLQEFQRILERLPGFDQVEMIYARVPILKFRDTQRGLEVDLNCNNAVGIRNTYLLTCYAELDKRVKPLVVIVKLWAQYHDINDAKSMTMSSYTLVLMVIHYLQFGCGDPVLPCLQKDCPDIFSANMDLQSIPKDRPPMVPWPTRNNTTVGDLFLGFLEYFALKFDYNRQVVSVRTGLRITKQALLNHRNYRHDTQQWNRFLCVEEPFDLTNTARSVYDKETFDRIRGVFYISWWRLRQTTCLDSVFTAITPTDAREISYHLHQPSSSSSNTRSY